MSTYGSSFINSYGIKNTGIGGLASGMNTDEIVEALTYGTRSKIAKQQQQQQYLKWQQSAYRSVASTLSSFKVKHFTFGGSAGGVSNLGSSSFFNTYKGVSSSDKISLVGNKTSAVGSVTVDRVLQLATRESIEVKREFSDELTGNAVNLGGDTKFYGRSLDIYLDNGATRNIRLDALDDIKREDFADADAFRAAFEKKLQGLVDTAIGTRSALDADGNLIAEGDGYKQESIVTVTLASVAAPVDEEGNPLSGDFFTVDLDSKSNRVTVASNNEALGLSVNQTNRLNMSDSIGDIFGLTGDEFAFRINGKEISVKATDTISTFMSRINSSAAGVRLSYSSITEQFTFTSETSGAGTNIDIQDVTGNLMRTFIGAPGSSTLSSNKLEDWDLGYGTELEGGNAVNLDQMLKDMRGKEASFTLTIGGVEKTITLPEVPEPGLSGSTFTWDGYPAPVWLQGNINAAIEKEFGKDSGVRLLLEEGDRANTYSISMSAPDTARVSITSTGDVDLLGKLGFTAETSHNDTRPDDVTLLKDLFEGVGDQGKFHITDHRGGSQLIEWGGAGQPQDLRELLADMNTKFGASDESFATIQDGRLVLNSADYLLSFDEADGDGLMMQKLFGTSAYNSAPPNDADAIVTRKEGTNAEILVGGHVLSQTSNTFTVDGIAFEVTETTTADDDPITITSKSDPDELVEKLSAFVDEYNTLIETLNTLVNESKVSGYTPLTEEQKAEMSESQVKAWETEAKKGLLFNDQTLRRITSDMRSVISKTVESAGLSLHQIGISVAGFSSNSAGTGYNFDRSGILQIDEAKLRATIEQNPDGVRMLFTGQEEGDLGIAYALTEVIEKATNTTSDPNHRGSLVRIAGAETLTGDNSSEIGSKLDRIDKYVSTLKTRLQKEYNRHWSKFTALETAIQRMNAQSSWLTDFGA